jgi:hypothetical protein
MVTRRQPAKKPTRGGTATQEAHQRLLRALSDRRLKNYFG